MRYIRALFLILLAANLVSACSPEVGSPSWCEAMENKPKGDWSSNEATDYAKNCLFKHSED
jgi:hypothetical protein